MATVAEELQRRNHSVAFLFQMKAKLNQPTVMGSIEAQPIWYLESHFFSDIFRQINQWRPDLVFSQGLVPPQVESKIIKTFPSVLFAHAYFGTCVSGKKRFLSPTFEVCHRRMGVGCLYCYYLRRCGGLSPFSLMKQFSIERFRNINLKKYRAIIVASQAMHEELDRHKLPSQHLVINAPPPGGVTPDPLPQIPPDWTDTIVYVGRLVESKGIFLAAEMMPLLRESLGREIKIKIAGTGPGKAPMESILKRHRIPYEFLGWVEPSARSDLIRSSDLLLLPSVWPEPFGLVGIEAACVGRPTVAFRLGGIPDWLIHGETGALAEANPPTAKGLQEAAFSLLFDHSRYKKVCKKAWEKSQEYSLRSHVERLETVFKEVIQTSR